MTREENLKRSLVDLHIKSGGKEYIKREQVPFDEAKQLCEQLLKDNPDDEWLQEHLSKCINSFGFMSTSHGRDNDVSISAGLPFEDTGERQTCGRRYEHPAAEVRNKVNEDRWEKLGEDRVCSYCGSIHPMDLIELRKQGVSITGTDKGYKFYINRAEVPNAGFGAIKYYNQHNTAEFVDAWNALLPPEAQG